MTETVQSPIPGFKVALTGEYGGGKTTSIRTLVEAGLEVFCIFTEDSRGLLNDIPSDKLHWCYIPPAEIDWDIMLDGMRKQNSLPLDALTKLNDPNKRHFDQLMKVVEACKNFKDERTGKEYGDVTTWNTDRVLFIDSMTGLNKMAMDLVVGNKPIVAQADWQMAQNNVENLVSRWTSGLLCHFVITAHVEREVDEVSGGIKLMLSTLGKKLAPKLPRKFDEVVLAKWVGPNAKDFIWSTADMNMTLKNRYLPKDPKLQPSFKPLVELWKQKGGIIAPTA